MKKQTLALFGLSLVFMIAAIFGTAATAHAAGNSYGGKVTYEVPFDFYVGNDKMSAGKYEVQRVSEWTYQIRRADGSKSVLVAAQVETGDENQVKTAKLIFNQYGQNHFLRAIYNRVHTNGRFVNESKTERRVKQENESEDNLAKLKSETVEIKGR